MVEGISFFLQEIFQFYGFWLLHGKELVLPCSIEFQIILTLWKEKLENEVYNTLCRP